MNRISRALARLSVGLLALAGLTTNAEAQIYDPVQWELELDTGTAAPAATVLARLKATIEPGWHIYSTTSPEGIPLGLEVAESDAVSAWRAHQPEPEVVFDPNFQAEVEWYSHAAEFLIELDLAPGITGEREIEARVRYGACDDKQCLPPKRKSATGVVAISASAAAAAAEVPAGYSPVKLNPVGRPRTSASIAALAASEAESFEPQDQGLLSFGLVAIGYGLLAILTPCVFPMIPIYMSSFMGGGARPWGAVLRQAGLFCAGVILIFTTLGAALSAFVGPFGLSQIGSNAWVNLLIAAVMFFFAANMLGAFEIALPSSWTSSVSERSAGTGIVPTLMLSLVFTLASFACIGAFVGPLLAGSVTAGGWLYPVLGMGLFSTGLSAPFLLLALFPALLGRLPRSGGWLVVSKRVVGLVIVGVGLKYLSNVDSVLAWELLTRERFLAIWIALAVAAALYLWGLVRLADEGPGQAVGLGRFGMGAGFLAIALVLLSGMLGASLGELEAHVPEASGAWRLSAAGEGQQAWIKDDYEGAAASARNAGKPLLVTFTGYACSNCKWMKANMFTRSEVQDVTRDFVLVELYTDGFDEASELHQEFQVSRFQSVSIPFYALERPDGTVAATFTGQTRDVDEFVRFLKSAS